MKDFIYNKKNYLALLFFVGLFLLSFLQYKIWLGEFSNSNLVKIENHIKFLELENKNILVLNESLKKEKIQLSSGKEAIEGIARRELGLIKDNEIFYRFSK